MEQDAQITDFEATLNSILDEKKTDNYYSEYYKQLDIWLSECRKIGFNIEETCELVRKLSEIQATQKDAEHNDAKFVIDKICQEVGDISNKFLKNGQKIEKKLFLEELIKLLAKNKIYHERKTPHHCYDLMVNLIRIHQKNNFTGTLKLIEEIEDQAATYNLVKAITLDIGLQTLGEIHEITLQICEKLIKKMCDMENPKGTEPQGHDHLTIINALDLTLSKYIDYLRPKPHETYITPHQNTCKLNTCKLIVYQAFSTKGISAQSRNKIIYLMGIHANKDKFNIILKALQHAVDEETKNRPYEYFPNNEQTPSKHGYQNKQLLLNLTYKIILGYKADENNHLPLEDLSNMLTKIEDRALKYSKEHKCLGAPPNTVYIDNTPGKIYPIMIESLRELIVTKILLEAYKNNNSLKALIEAYAKVCDSPLEIIILFLASSVDDDHKQEWNPLENVIGKPRALEIKKQIRSLNRAEDFLKPSAPNQAKVNIVKETKKNLLGWGNVNPLLQKAIKKKSNRAGLFSCFPTNTKKTSAKGKHLQTGLQNSSGR